MKFEKKLVHGTFVRRHKRFLVDVKLDDNSIITAHTSNTGSMKSCLEEGAEVYLSESDNPNRKTKYTWEMIKINSSWVGINTLLPNKIAYQALLDKVIPGMDKYYAVKKEVKWGDSRLDLCAKNEFETCYIEVKNVTYRDGIYARFPDAISKRGAKHLDSLIEIKQAGMRAVMFYIIQRMDVEVFTPAHEIDAVYSKKLSEAIKAGVEIIPIQLKVSPREIKLRRILPFEN